MPTEVPLEMQATVTFEEGDGRTTLTIRHVGLSGEMAVPAEAGWNESLDKLAASFSS
jgi:hypothetical protein